jgi:uroporphyrin-3 C-methyltransferase
LLIALAALAGGGFLYYQLWYVKSIDSLAGRVRSLETSMPELRQDLSDLGEAQQLSLATLAVRQREELEQARQSIITALNDASEQAPASPREWKLAEIEYLLRIANHRILMERDADAALTLLIAADGILFELDDFALYQVRAELAEEVLALDSVTGNDLQGIYLRLEAIKDNLVNLPLDVPEYLSRRTALEPPTEEPGPVDAFLEQLSRYLQLRRFNTAAKPLLAPEEAVHLELNLRLMLERSQLAILGRQQLVYEQSLTTTRRWLIKFLDVYDPDVMQIVTEIDGLIVIELNPALPDISGSLGALQRVRRSES